MKVKQIGLYYDLSFYWIEKKRGLTLCGAIKNLFKKKKYKFTVYQKLKPRKDPLKKTLFKSQFSFLMRPKTKLRKWS